MRAPEATAAMSDKGKVRDLFGVMLPYYLYERAHDFKFLAQKRRVKTMLHGRIGRVLDLGCGPGLMTPVLAEQGWDVYGIDFLEPVVAYAKGRAAEAPWEDRAHYVVGDAEILAFRERAFDAVIAMGVLEYLADVDRFLAEVHRVLRPGGLIVIAVPSLISPHHLVSAVLDRFVAPLYRAVRRFVTGINRRGQIPDHPRRPLVPWSLDRLLARASFRKEASAFSNFRLYPLDRFFPELCHRIERRCHTLEESRMLGWLGTQYIVAAVKKW